MRGALCMSDAEQSKRMRLMRHVVKTFDTYWWADQLLDDALVVNSAGHALAHGDTIVERKSA